MAAFGEILRRSQGAKDADRSMGSPHVYDCVSLARLAAGCRPSVGRTAAEERASVSLATAPDRLVPSCG